MKHDKTTNAPRDLLRQNNLRCTTARLAILNILSQASQPYSQETIAQQINDESINKVTIYRALNTFLDHGIVHKAFTRQRIAHYELAHHCSSIQCHPHFTCTRCGNTHCLLNAKIPLTKNLPKGFKIHRQQVILQGLCPKCAKN
ncbi:MAG: transcriptional repressor [Sedimentisphaerales bacterium]|nr:transcriptional repressor [Sedimentisphaerales bacterium]